LLVNSFPDCLDGVPSLKGRVDFGKEAANQTASRNGFFTAKSVNYVPSRSSGHGDDQNHQKSSKIITVELYDPTIVIRNHQKSSTIINNHHFLSSAEGFSRSDNAIPKVNRRIGT